MWHGDTDQSGALQSAAAVSLSCLLSVLFGHFGVNNTRLIVSGCTLAEVSGRRQTFTYAGNQSIGYASWIVAFSKDQFSVQSISSATQKTLSNCLNVIICSLICTLTTLRYSTAVDWMTSIINVQAQVRDCTNKVAHCCKSRRLQLNDKTEAIWFGSHSNLTKLSGANRSMTVSSATIRKKNVAVCYRFVALINNYVRPRDTRTEMYAGRVASCFWWVTLSINLY